MQTRYSHPRNGIGLALWLVLSLITNTSHAADAIDSSGKDISNKDYSNKNLNKSNFSDAVCEGTNFMGCSLKQVNFKGANLKDAMFSGADCTEADFTGATGNIFFVEVTLNKVNLEGVAFTLGNRCKLREANLKKAKISGSFNNADLYHADLSGANLRGTSIYKESAKNLKGAYYNDDTAFPDSFDPKQAGMILKEADKEKKDDPKKQKPGE